MFSQLAGVKRAGGRFFLEVSPSWLPEMLELFVCSFPFFCTNHSGQEVGRQKQLGRKGRRLREITMPRSGHVPRAHGGLGAGHLKLKGTMTVAPSSGASLEGGRTCLCLREGLRDMGQGVWAWKRGGVGRGWGPPYREVEASGYRINQAQVAVGR